MTEAGTSISCTICPRPKDIYGYDEISRWFFCIGASKEISEVVFYMRVAWSELAEMSSKDLQDIFRLDTVIARRIQRCIEPEENDAHRQHSERTGGVPLASGNQDLIGSEWDPMYSCIRGIASSGQCRRLHESSENAEAVFACKEIFSEGVEAADAVLIADCLSELGYPTAVALQVDG